ncbi:MAG: glycoside hydrolase family protein [Chamaesiphon sp.]
MDTIAWAEVGKVDLDGYKSLAFSGKFNNNFAQHPGILQCAMVNEQRLCSTAAGRYQMMDFNWSELAPKLGLKDFSPQSQDRMALELIRQQGAVEDLLAGRFEDAVYKVSGIWASFPGNDYEQNPKSIEELSYVYQQSLYWRQMHQNALR